MRVSLFNYFDFFFFIDSSELARSDVLGLSRPTVGRATVRLFSLIVLDHCCICSVRI